MPEEKEIRIVLTATEDGRAICFDLSLGDNEVPLAAINKGAANKDPKFLEEVGMACVNHVSRVLDGNKVDFARIPPEVGVPLVFPGPITRKEH